MSHKAHQIPKLQGKVAFVTGANGVSGNAIIEHLIRQPKSEWSKIVVTSRSPLGSFWQDPRLDFVAIDYLRPVDEIVAKTKKLCKDVTHAFFTSYVHVDDFALLKERNVPLFRNFLDALTLVAPNLQRVVLQTGGKHYGVHLGPVKAPLDETMPRYEDDGFNFYYQQEDYMFDLQKKGSWSHNIIRPNAIIGYTPHNNGMSQALTAALYFLVCRELEVNADFPGNKALWNSVDDMSYAPGIADMSVWAATSEVCKDEAFNHCNGDVIVWRYFWPVLGAHFGVKIDEPNFVALGESGNKMERNFSMIDWAKDKKPVWERVCKKYGGNPEAFDWGTWGFFDWTTGKTWPTFSTNNKARKFGWTRVDDTVETWLETFKSFENGGILPKPASYEVELDVVSKTATQNGHKDSSE